MSAGPAAPFPCPNCGSTDDVWKADYYEAVWQSVTILVGEDGKPELFDYTGVTGSYDDGSTEDERYVCRNCEHEIVLGRFEMIPEGERWMKPDEAILLLFGEDWKGNPGAQFRSGADIAAGLAAYFGLDAAAYRAAAVRLGLRKADS